MSELGSPNMAPSEGAAARFREKGETAECAGSAMRRRLRDRLEVAWRTANRCAAETRSRVPALRQQIGDQAAHVADRARYYHENQPLSALGAVVAAAFVVGIAIGFGRR